METYSVSDAREARSSVIFILRDAESMPADLLSTFLALLHEFGAPVAILACYQSLSAAPGANSFGSSFVTVSTKNVTTDTLDSNPAAHVLNVSAVLQEFYSITFKYMVIVLFKKSCTST